MLWLQISAGVGPAECQEFVAKLAPLVCAEAQSAGLSAQVLEAVPGENAGTLRSALVSIEASEAGDRERAFAQTWVGTVQWICKSRFRPQHKRRNWFAGIECFGVPERPTWQERDLEVTTMTASGPGGQHVNKTESAVRITHKPTGLVAVAREERSQQQNRKLALARLAALFEAQSTNAEAQVQQARWEEHRALERGNAVRVYEGTKLRRKEVPQGRV